MYLRRTTRRRKDGSAVGYLQLAHNEWDAKAGHSVVRVLYSFGREDRLDRQAIVRLIGSLQRALEPDEALAAAAGSELEFVESRPMGGAWALDRLWRTLGIDRTLARLLAGRRLDARRAGAVRDGRQPRVGAAVEAGGEQVGVRARLDRRAQGAG